MIEKGDYVSFWDLISKNQNILNEKNDFGDTILMEVINVIDIDNLKKVLLKNTDLNVVDEEGMSLIHLLIGKKSDANLEKIKVLIESGANVEIVGFNGWRPLHRAAFYRCYETAKYLLNKGADPNSKVFQSKYETPLMIAASRNDKEMVKILLEHGAKVRAKDKYNKDAFDYCNFFLGKGVRKILKYYSP